MKYFLVRLSLVTVFLFCSIIAYIGYQLNSSLPELDGQLSFAPLSQKVVITRDRQGIPSISAKNKQDIYFSMGFLHAQERFFQMDLIRRSAAGELAELFGKAALTLDQQHRLHRFRWLAQQRFQSLPKAQQTILTHYTEGVNAGLTQLNNYPFEYLLLQMNPKPWTPEDSLLVIYNMYFELQSGQGYQERTVGQLYQQLPLPIAQFLYPPGSIWDAAIDSSTVPTYELPHISLPQLSTIDSLELNPELLPYTGSNNFTVSQAISTSGHAIIAGDMHLGLSVPNTWYRLQITYPKQTQQFTITGISLPGAPAIVAGSNQFIAWAFTNSYGDWNDVIALQLSDDGQHYATPTGAVKIETIEESILVKDESPHILTIETTQWGPIIHRDDQQALAYRWVAYDKQAVDLELIALEQAKNIYDAVNIAHRSGIPAQNMLVADHYGEIAWTIIGPIPVRQHPSGLIPQDWSQSNIGWQGYLDAENYPTIIAPNSHRLWTANSRVVGQESLAKLGDGNYALGARAQQIRDQLFAKKLFSEQDLLNIQLDDRAIFLKRWQHFLLEQLSSIASQKDTDQSLTSMIDLLQQWSGYADKSSASYYFVRTFRRQLMQAIFEPIFSSLAVNDPEVSFRHIHHRLEIPLWQLIQQQPDSWLPKQYQSWKELFVLTSLKAFKEINTSSSSTSELITWGQENTTSIQHPFSKFFPLLSILLDPKQSPQSGDSFMPKVTGKNFGASQRFVVSPGNEAQGIFHMPAGQSGHPLSPYYLSQHEAWLEGKMSPFLPGESYYQLILTPDNTKT